MVSLYNCQLFHLFYNKKPGKNISKKKKLQRKEEILK